MRINAFLYGKDLLLLNKKSSTMIFNHALLSSQFVDKSIEKYIIKRNFDFTLLTENIPYYFANVKTKFLKYDC